MKSLEDIVHDNDQASRPRADGVGARRLKVLTNLDPVVGVRFHGHAEVRHGALTIYDHDGRVHTIFAPGLWLSVAYLD